MSSPPPTTIAVVALLVAFGLYRRFKRAVGRREVTRWFAFRAALLAVFAFGFVGILALDAVRGALALLASGGIGLALGTAIGVTGVRTATFEREEGTLFVTTHRYVSLGILVLVVGRIAYRFAAMYTAFQQSGSGAPNTSGLSSFHDPLTLGLLGLLLAYYALTYLGVVWVDHSGATT